MKKLAILLISAVCTFGSATGQDVHFSQFMQAPMQINPGLTGMIPANIRANLAYRSQWASVTTPYRTFLFSGDVKIPVSDYVSLGAGLNFYRDMAGDTKFGTTSAKLALSSIVTIDDHNEISAGLMGGIMQVGMDPSALQWDSQYQGGSYNGAIDPGENLDLNPGIMPDLSAGVVYHYHSEEGYMTANDQLNVKIGAAFNHFIRPKMTFMNSDTLYSNITMFADAQIGIGNSRWTAMPSVLYMMQGPARELTFGGLMRFRLQDASQITGFIKGAFLYLGGYYRLRDAFAPMVMLEFDRYALGVSYDLNTSPLAVASNMRGGLEITFRFMTPNPYLYQGQRASFR